MSIVSVERYGWSGGRDEEGNRIYNLIHEVVTDDVNDGPLTVMLAPGLPFPGSFWLFGNEADGWAFCTPAMKIEGHSIKGGEANIHWLVTQQFSTKSGARCQDTPIEDPLQEPQKVSGSFVKYTKEVTKNKDGDLLKTSSHELLRGPQMEFDHNRPTVHIEQNVLSLGLSTFAGLIDHVNDSNMWGLEPRHVKLSNASWERKVLGSCGFYYTRIFDFDIDQSELGFDRKVDDRGQMVLRGQWVKNPGVPPDWVPDPDADPANIKHFIRYHDANGNPAIAHLDGSGGLRESGDPVEIDVEYYQESNLFALGVPTSF